MKYTKKKAARHGKLLLLLLLKVIIVLLALGIGYFIMLAIPRILGVLIGGIVAIIIYLVLINKLVRFLKLHLPNQE